MEYGTFGWPPPLIVWEIPIENNIENRERGTNIKRNLVLLLCVVVSELLNRWNFAIRNRDHHGD